MNKFIKMFALVVWFISAAVVAMYLFTQLVDVLAALLTNITFIYFAVLMLFASYVYQVLNDG